MNKLSCFLGAILFTGITVFAQDGGVEGAEQEGGSSNEQVVNSSSEQTVVTEIASIRAEDNGGNNPLSSRPIHLSDQMWRKTVWRALDLREKQNKPLFSHGREISRIIIDAVKKGKLTPYENDSLLKPITIEKFTENITIPTEDVGLSEEEKALGFSDEDEWGSDDEGGGWGDAGIEEEETVLGPEEYFPTQIYQMQVKEDMIFDKQRSRMYEDVQAITLLIPAGETIKGIEEPVASFRYLDLLNVFREDPRAIWFNPENDAEHKNLAEAFDLRTFHSYIIRLSNPDHLYLEDIYGTPEAGIRASEKTMWDLLEYEHHLWEF